MLDRELRSSLSESERRELRRENAVELSRLVVRPDASPFRDAREEPHPVEKLLKQLYHLSKEHKFEHFYIVVEQDWLRPFFRRFGLPFQVIGTPHIFPDGTKTVAALASLEELEAGMRRHSAHKYDWYQR